MRVLRHIFLPLCVVILSIAIPLFFAGFFNGSGSKEDAITSASVIIDRPSGEYVVWINKDKHTNSENLNTWERFFRGEDIDFLFEDIACVVASTDEAGIDIAKSFESRLPENQMTIRTEDVTLMLSKACDKRYDVIIMSKEVYDAYGADKLSDKVCAVCVKPEER